MGKRDASQAGTRTWLVLLTFFFDWRDAVAIVKPETFEMTPRGFA
jgi:hypothetical protein